MTSDAVHAGAWHNADVLENLRSKYGDNIRFVFRDFPVITPESPKAAEAGQCAYDQGKFWEYHDQLYTAPAIDVPHLKEFAAATGLDMASFNQCLDSGRHAPTVDQDLQDAIKRGFPGTPAFLLNDRPLEGPPTLENFQTTIDRVMGGCSLIAVRSSAEVPENFAIRLAELMNGVMKPGYFASSGGRLIGARNRGRSTLDPRRRIDSTFASFKTPILSVSVPQRKSRRRKT